MRFQLSGRLCVALALAAFLAGVGFAEAQARRGRSGPSSAQIQKMMQQQYQQQAAIAGARQKKDQQIIAQFDLNGNGRIDGPAEKGPFDKFMREVQLGKRPHPYDTITANDLKAATPTTAKKK